MTDLNDLLRTPHGIHVLHGGKSDAEETLLRAGWAPFDGNGRPALVLLCDYPNQASKRGWFLAGFWMGTGVPLFVVNKEPRRKNLYDHVIRCGGWMVVVPDAAALLAAVERRGLWPTEWDRTVSAAASPMPEAS